MSSTKITRKPAAKKPSSKVKPRPDERPSEAAMRIVDEKAKAKATTAAPKRHRGLPAAILTVLGDAKEPLSAREIWDQIEARKLHSSHGRTPWATVAAWCYTHDQAVEKTERGQFRLRK
jgi:hypothetical protein